MRNLKALTLLQSVSDSFDVQLYSLQNKRRALSVFWILLCEQSVDTLEFGISYRRQQKMQQTFQLLSIILIQQTLVAANAVLVLNDSFIDMLYLYRFLILYF